METETTTVYQPPLERNEDGSIKNIRPYQPCAGGHKVDEQVPKLQDIQFDNRTCDCGRMRFVVESCGCGENAEKELHGYPNQT